MRVFYRPEMVADGKERHSPSASKPRRVIDDWTAKGLDIEVKKPYPASPAMIKQVHDDWYVNNVLGGVRANGFGDCGQDVIDALPFTVGAMVQATKYALKTGKNAAALVSGFHHAGYESGGGFCTFNGLMVAAIEAKKAGARKVGILDLDEHYGNGTADIIRKLKIKGITHVSSGEFFHSPTQAEKFLTMLPQWVKSFWDCDVLIVQFGADQFEGDPLGGVLSLDGLRKRDRIVFETADAMRLPIAWNLAGGYTKDDVVLDIHRATAEECIRVEKERAKK